MRKPVCWCALALVVSTAAAWGEVVDRVLATVDTEVILQSEVMEEIAPYVNGLPRASESDFNREVSRALREALTRAIDLKILYRQAMLAGKGVPEEHREEWEKRVDRAVEERLDQIRKNFDKPDQTFLDWLESSGEVMADFRESFKKQFIAVNMANEKRREFENGVVVSESDIAQYFQDHGNEFERPELVWVRRIYLNADKDKASREKAKARIEALRDEVLRGADFAALAKAHSEGPEAAVGGLISENGTARGDFVPALEQAAFALNKGEVSEPVETEWGYHLLLVEDRREAGVVPLEEAWPEIERILREQQADERFDKWLEDLRKRSRVRVYL